MSLSLREQADQFSEKYLRRGERPLRHFSNFVLDLEKLVISAGFKQTIGGEELSSELGSDAYVREENPCGLIVLDDTFQSLFEPHITNSNYITFVSFDSVQEIQKFNQQYLQLFDLWNEEGILRRDMDIREENKTSYVVPRAVGVALAGLGIGVSTAVTSESLVTILLNAVAFGTVFGAGAFIHYTLKVNKTLDARSELMSQYETELGRFTARYRNRTWYDQEALEHALQR